MVPTPGAGPLAMSILSAAALLPRRALSAAATGRVALPAFVARRLASSPRTLASRWGGAPSHFHPVGGAVGDGCFGSLRPGTGADPALDMSTATPSLAASVSEVAAGAAPVLVGIDRVRAAVASALNDAFDPAEIARGAAIARLDGKDKKKKKKKKSERSDQEPEPPGGPKMSADERAVIVDAAAIAARPFSAKDAMVTPATRPEFGDYQCNAAMSLAGPAGMSPRECARRIVAALEPRLAGIVEAPLEIAGPGFINLRFDESYLKKAVREMARDSGGRLAVPPTRAKKKIVVDFSSPNIAKEMHVGHLRSTIIGDTLSNLLSFAGHDVVRLNHVGDWGTQFGMLVEHLRDECPQALDPDTSGDVDLGDLVTLYKGAKRRFDVDGDFRERSREGVVRLQAGDTDSVAAWELLCAASRVEYQRIYDRLSIVELEERGESFYSPYLAGVVDELERMGLAVESEGATAVFLDGHANRDGSPLPLIVRKSDGGFNYATTDLAAVRHRVQLGSQDGGEGADRVLYVTDAGQSQHFQMVFAAAEKAGFVPEGVSLEHVPFGLVQGEDGRKFATRSGDTVRLKDLLDEAVRIAGEDVRSRAGNPDGGDELSDAVADVARTVGIGAVKYADLSMNRESNYRFSYGRMLSLNGNTAPYMLYAYARICGIVRRATGQRAGEAVMWPGPAGEVLIVHDSERQLARILVKMPDVLAEVEAELYPNRLCEYLFETSQRFNQFYENCSVNNAETLELRASRLSLCTVTASTIRLLMGLLGIPVVEKL